ncbi:hypothetical protein [Actinomadura flavalba]|nr:hypothetical protein [Actinomadura flavalba]
MLAWPRSATDEPLRLLRDRQHGIPDPLFSGSPDYAPAAEHAPPAEATR